MTNKPRSILHFAHANGFPAQSYKKFFSALNDDFDVIAIERFGHDSRFPVANNWHLLAQEMIHYIEQNNRGEAVHGVGHSFGAVVSYIAACERPDLFKTLTMLDPPLVTGFSRHLFAVAKRTPLIDRLTPAKLAVTRKRKWPLHIDMVDYFANKGLFKAMDRDCVKDYVDAVIQQTPHHQLLNFAPEIEAQVFRTVPDNLNRYFGKLQCPATLITGAQTNVCVPALRNAFIRGNGLIHREIQGGHMFPLERPLEVGKYVADTIESMAATQINNG